MFDDNISTPIVRLIDEDLQKSQVQLYIKREDLTDPIISGNKYRKLKYNLIEAKNKGCKILLTFGGAFSNHIHAVAYAGKKFGFKTIGIIRGEESLPLNPTLQDAVTFDMELHYISRPEYRRKNDKSFIEHLEAEFGNFYLIPEGGSNTLAVKGCTEILQDVSIKYDYICCACGTGGTIAGIITSLAGRSKILGFPALKNGEFLKNDISKLIMDYSSASYDNWDLITDYHFGGYAKYDYNLIQFINRFKIKHDIQLDPIYTGKLLYGIFDLINNGKYKPKEKILVIHTGGIQGIRGFNERFGNLIK